MRSNNLITWEDITLSISEWEEILEVPSHRIRSRIQKGWGIERALFEPRGALRVGAKINYRYQSFKEWYEMVIKDQSETDYYKLCERCFNEAREVKAL